MSITVKRVVAALLSITAGSVGAWATAAPESFYRSFPGPGHHWVATLPPYNEHLVRDVGALYLGFLVMTVWAAVRPREETFRVVGAGWLMLGMPHLAFHADHLGSLSTADAAANLVSLSLAVVLAALLLWPLRVGGGVR